jgi:DNA-directed RNA polymerase subunit RPC12/RpoP
MSDDWPSAAPVRPAGPDRLVDSVLRCPSCPTRQWAYRIEIVRNRQADGTPLVSFHPEIIKASPDLPDLDHEARCPDCGGRTLRREAP